MRKNLILFLTVAALLAGAASRGETTFTEIKQGDIVTDLGQWVGAQWGDFHNSGLLDLIVCNYPNRTNVYYKNNGDGTFTKVTQGDPVEDRGAHIYAGVGDYDNDGNLDLIVTAGAYNASTTNRLYRNNGDGTFSLSLAPGVSTQRGRFGPGIWGDYDNDGFLDLFFANHGVSNDNGGKNLLFRNNGDGSFTTITEGSIVNDLSVGFCATWSDYDGDGYVDLLVLNNGLADLNFLYHNNQNGSFTRIRTNIIGSDRWPNGASCAAWGDYDNDGQADLFITDQAGVRCQLYHNDGNGVFTRIEGAPQLFPPGGGSYNGCGWGDFDNDGYLDLAVSGNGVRHGLFRNNGDGTFTKIVTGPVATGGGPGLGGASVSWVDYDADGSLDLFITMFSNTGAPGEVAHNVLYHNDGNTNGWLELKLVGTASNRSAIGAKVRVHATVGGKSFWQLREINTGGGYDTPPLVAHFGLGDAVEADEVRIEWPSGIVQTLTHVAPRQMLTITEHQMNNAGPSPRFSKVSSAPDGSVSLSVSSDTGMIQVIEGSTDLLHWAKLGSRTNVSGTVSFTDPAAGKSGQRFYRTLTP